MRDPKVASDPRFKSNVARVNHRAETDARVGGFFASVSAKEAIERLSAAEIAFAVVNDMAGLSAHPQSRIPRRPPTGGNDRKASARSPLWANIRTLSAANFSACNQRRLAGGRRLRNG